MNKFEKEVWEEIDEFPNYMVSSFGQVANIRMGGTILTPRPNQFGHIRVGLVKDNRQYNRGLALLVATAFIQNPMTTWDTVIHLDGDLYNCAASNLMWRPRWFTLAFHKQFYDPRFVEDHGPIIDLESSVVYDSPKEACVKHGLLYTEIIRSINNGYSTFPFAQRWASIDSY